RMSVNSDDFLSDELQQIQLDVPLFDNLPNEIIKNIVSNLDFIDRINVKSVDRRLNQLVEKMEESRGAMKTFKEVILPNSLTSDSFRAHLMGKKHVIAKAEKGSWGTYDVVALYQVMRLENSLESLKLTVSDTVAQWVVWYYLQSRTSAIPTIFPGLKEEINIYPDPSFFKNDTAFLQTFISLSSNCTLTETAYDIIIERCPLADISSSVPVSTSNLMPPKPLGMVELRNRLENMRWNSFTSECALDDEGILILGGVLYHRLWDLIHLIDALKRMKIMKQHFGELRLTISDSSLFDMQVFNAVKELNARRVIIDCPELIDGPSLREFLNRNLEVFIPLSHKISAEELIEMCMAIRDRSVLAQSLTLINDNPQTWLDLVCSRAVFLPSERLVGPGLDHFDGSSFSIINGSFSLKVDNFYDFESEKCLCKVHATVDQ
ncbi:hypothetical protein PFISCL1PPCAC_18932, partial [Pristionchus fissidentatus]